MQMDLRFEPLHPHEKARCGSVDLNPGTGVGDGDRLTELTGLVITSPADKHTLQAQERPCERESSPEDRSS